MMFRLCSRVLHGTDYNGNICGVTAAVKDSPYVAWPYIYGAPDATICMKSCADTLV